MDGLETVEEDDTLREVVGSINKYPLPIPLLKKTLQLDPPVKFVDVLDIMP